MAYIYLYSATSVADIREFTSPLILYKYWQDILHILYIIKFIYYYYYYYCRVECGSLISDI